MRADYRSWLEAQEYGSNTISTQLSHASRIEQAYGDLEALYQKDNLASVAESFRYSKEDSRRGAPNPSQISIGGDIYKSLASFRSAIGLYRRFLDTEKITPTYDPSTSGIKTLASDPDRERIGLERDLQKTLRREIHQLDPNLSIIDDGVERAVASGYIDITAQHTDGTIVVIELKAGTGDCAAIGQILSYMGDLSDDEPGTEIRGILVAHQFDARAMSAAKIIPSLELRSYSVQFVFHDPAKA